MEYQKDYKEFLTNYNLGITSPEETGLLIAKMANHFMDANTVVGSAQTRYDDIYSVNIQSTDPENGKATSAAKAEVLSKASEEGKNLTLAKIHVQNIEQILNSLKSLQKGALNEYSHMGAS